MVPALRQARRPMPAAQVTAYGFLEVLQVPRGEHLLQTAAGSTLGRQLIVLARERGVRSVNLVRRKAQEQELLDIGARPSAAGRLPSQQRLLHCCKGKCTVTRASVGTMIKAQCRKLLKQGIAACCFYNGQQQGRRSRHCIASRAGSDGCRRALRCRACSAAVTALRQGVGNLFNEEG